MREKLIVVFNSTFLAMLLCLALFGIKYICTEAAEPQIRTKIIYLTPEEMANRPLMSKVVEKTEKIEAVVEDKTVCTIKDEFKVYDEIPLDAELQIYTQELCKEYKVGYAFFLAMCESESSFISEARGDSNRSLGYMQINKPNWERYGLDASMIYDNFEIGIRMMSELIDKYGEFDAVVMAYKGGESFADEWLAQGKRLDSCDTLAERTNYWQEVIDK